MTWNYRVVKRIRPQTILYSEAYDPEYGIYAAYYGKDSDVPDSISLEQVVSDSADGLKSVMDKITDALEKPVLIYEDFV
jgi:hypothetical protein